MTVSKTAPTLDGIPVLGVGLGYRDPFRAELFQNRSRVDFLEIVADHYFEASRFKQQELELLKTHFPLIPHGLNLSLGGAEGLDEDYLGRLAAVVEAVDPPYWSEHIAFTKAGGVEIGHLTPLPFTDESLDVLCRNVEAAQYVIQRPLILENITYQVTFPFSSMDEATFLGELLDRTGCGLLLDVTNLYTNSVNFRFDPIAFLQRLPAERIVQLHFVGGHWRDGTLIDSHSRPTPPEVWSLLAEVLRCASVKGVILERDENLPPLNELLDELDRARGIGRHAGRWA